MVKLPGLPVPASVWRLPRVGGQMYKVLDITLRSIQVPGTAQGILFQPEQRTLFTQQSGGFVKRHYCFADWPSGALDPMPVHPGDNLLIPASPLPTSTVQALPAPSTTAFTVKQGDGASFVPYQPVDISGMMPFPEPIIQQVSGDTITLEQPLTSVPAVGATVTQPGSRFPVEDCDPYAGHHLSIFVDLTPRR